MAAVLSPRRALALLTLGAAIVLLAGLDRTELWAPDEPRYAQVAEELRRFENGPRDLVVLRLNGEVYSQKPPLYYWMAAAFGALGGRVSETGARLPSALAGIGLVALTAGIGRYLFGRAAPGLLGGALLLTVFRFSHLARRAQLDVVLALFEALAIAAFWAAESGATRKRRLAVGVLHGSMGLAALTKGPVGWLPLLVIVGYLGLERRLGEVRSWIPAWGLVLSVGPLLLWIGSALTLAPAGLFDAAIVDNLFGRFFAGTSHARPVYYFLYQLPLDFLPWTLLWPLVWLAWRERSAGSDESADSAERAGWRFLLLWIGVFLVFFTLSAGKRGLYLLPAYPAVALLCGAAIDHCLPPERLPRWVALALCLAATLLGLAGGWILLGRPFAVLEVMAPASFGIALAGLGGLGLACAAWLRGRRQPMHAVVLGVVTLAAFELAVFTLYYPAWNAEKSPAPIARAAARLTQPDERVGIFDHASLVGGILYYGERRVVSLPNAEDVKRFFDEGGRILITKRYKLPWLVEAGPLEILASSRTGGREIVLVGRHSTRTLGSP